MKMKIKLKIKRLDPVGVKAREPYIQAYNVEASEGMTVLEALLQIANSEDTSLSFRRSCRSAICGSCAVTINGFPKLACNTQALGEYRKKGALLIEPLSNHPVIKDLVVDFSTFWNKMDKITPYLTPTAESQDGKEDKRESMVIKKEDQEAIDRAQKCIMCGCCNSACNALEVNQDYLAPAALSKAWRFVGDVREGHSKKRLEHLSEDNGVWDCVRCVHCTEYCPKDVAPLRSIEKLRSQAVNCGIIDNHGAKHTISMTDSIKRVGRLDEAAMTFKTLGFLRSLGMIPLGIKMQLHGKMPHPILFPKIKGMDEIDKIYGTRYKKGSHKKKGN